MRVLFRFTHFAFLAFVLFSCAEKGKKQEQKLPEYESGTVPAPITSPEEILKHQVLHYWDLFPFDDIRSIQQEGYAEKAFTHFVQLLQNTDLQLATQGVVRMVSGIDRAGKTDTVQKRVLLRFNEMAEHFFHHPNSPFRDDELYIPLLEYFVSSPLPDALEKVRPSYLLHAAYKNRVGSSAANFHFVQAFENKQKTLYGLKAPFTLLFFIHPDCQACMGVTQELLSSVFVTHLVENNLLVVLTLYPEEDLKSWLQFLPHLPSNWLHAYNPDNEIYNEELYYLNAIPSLYLLDDKKEVLVKDAVSVRQIERVLRERAHFL